MSRGKIEVALLVLDVSPSMTPYIPHMRRSVNTLLHSKLTNRLTHQTAIVLFGTAGSANVLAEGFGDNQYSNITTIQIPSVPTLETVRNVDAALAAAAAPGGAAPRGADWANGLIVGWDEVWTAIEETKGLKAKARIRVILVSNFASPGLGDPTADVMPLFVKQFKHEDAFLEIIDVDLPLPDPLLAVNRANNLALWRQICEGGVRHSIRTVTAAGDLAGLFRAVESPLDSHVIATMHLEIGKGVKIPIKLSLKTDRAKAPSLGSASCVDRNDGGEPDGVKRSTDWYLPGTDIELRRDGAIPDELRVKGYRYGTDSMPFGLGDEVNAAYKLQGQRCLRLLGFVPLSEIPREHYLDKVTAVVANADSPAAVTAMAALVRAMAASEDVAIMRLVRSASASRFKVEICAAVPAVAAGGAADELFLVQLPFFEDMRLMDFPSIESHGKMPREEQQTAAEDLVDAMTLGDDDLAPQHTAAPALHRFSAFFMQRALEGAGEGQPWWLERERPLPDELLEENDTLLQRVVRGAGDDAGAAARLAQVCATGRGAARRQRAAVHRLRPGHAEEDLAAMVEQEAISEAAYAVREEIVRLVEKVTGDAGHAEAVRLLRQLRVACLQKRHGAAFNRVMYYLADNIGQSMIKRRFWRAVVVGATPVLPVSAEEAAEAAGQEGTGGFGFSLMSRDRVEAWRKKQVAAVGLESG